MHVRIPSPLKRAMISPRDFVDRWSQSTLREQQAAQSHFNELCELVGHKTPTQLDPEGTFFTFEENVEKATGGKGRADVWYKGRFAWEYKGKHKDLDEAYKQYWWIHVEPRPGMRKALANLGRYIGTVIVAKHRLFTWFSGNVLPDHRLYVFAGQDDFLFGVLHSYLHEVWSLRLGSTLEDRPSYIGERCFETFPFPWPPGKEDTASPAYQAVSVAAKQLHEEREAWLNPPDFPSLNLGAGKDSTVLRERTLTNLYNALVAHRQNVGVGAQYAAPLLPL
jgi:hypothetical protein